MSLRNNLDFVKKNIKQSCDLIKKNDSDIILLAVTKTVSLNKMHQIYDLTINNFGENKVQELLEKYDHFSNNVNWHLIGHLQTNKVKYIIDKVVLIHSVESVKLANEINKRASSLNKKIDILIEVNIALEDSKFGILPDKVNDFIFSLKDLNNINIKGLMTVAPYVTNPEDNRCYFQKMKNLFDDLKNINMGNLKPTYLSMGMTSDYTVAIEEGANIVRVGTGLFGERDYF